MLGFLTALPAPPPTLEKGAYLPQVQYPSLGRRAWDAYLPLQTDLQDLIRSAMSLGYRWPPN